MTEKLSEMVARQYLVTPRRQIIATTLLARRRRHKFVRAVSRGLLPPETPPALRRVRKRRLPGLVGMDPPDDVSLVTFLLWYKDYSFFSILLFIMNHHLHLQQY